MLTEIYTFEAALKGGVGAILFLLPITTARVIGLPHGNIGLWARILGATFIGIAVALWVENDVQDVRGLGLGGLIAINAVSGVALLVIALSTPLGSKRGAILIWLAIVLLFALSILEIAQL
ncbi:MAG: hypothetical protein AAFR55_07165, partial [Pseudomonadota bacterium]